MAVFAKLNLFVEGVSSRPHELIFNIGRVMKAVHGDT